MKVRETGRDLIAFLLRKPFLFSASAILLAALYGSWAFRHVVTFDAEGLFSPGSAAVWYAQWVELGRWGLVVLKKLFLAEIINPYFSAAVFLAGFPLSAVLWTYLFGEWGAEQDPGEMLLFAALYMTHPVWALQFCYRNQMEAIVAAVLLLEAGTLFFGRWIAGRRVRDGIAALLLIAFTFNCYQSFIFLYLAAAAACFLLRYTEGKADGAWFWSEFLRAALFTAAAFILSRISAKISLRVFSVTSRGQYLTDQIRWGKDETPAIAARVLLYLKESLWGNKTVYTALFGVEAVILLILLAAGVIRKKRADIPVLLASFGLLFFPFLLETATGGQIVARSRFDFAFAAAALGLWECRQIRLAGRFIGCREKAKKTAAGVLWKAAVIFLLAAVLMQSAQTARILYTDVKVMEEDRRKLETIYYTAMALGAHEGDALCMVGGKTDHANAAMVDVEIAGYSYLEHNGFYGSGKTIEAMRAYGLSVKKPDNAQVRAAKKEAEKMEVWPSAGSIRVKDGFIIVRLG